HRRLPEQKGASVPGRRFELPRTATSPPRSQARNPGIVTVNPTNLTAIPTCPQKRSSSVGFTGQHRRIRRSSSVGNLGHLPSEYTAGANLRHLTPGTRLIAIEPNKHFHPILRKR